MKIDVIVVSYNRKKLLTKCVDNLRKQTFGLNKIVVVDNGSEDGSRDWLESQKDIITIVQDNVGGAGGYCKGLEYCLKSSDCDYVWLMDDDTIPQLNSLACLVDKLPKLPSLGFVCSQCVWSNGETHLMNIPNISTFVQGDSFNKYISEGVLVVNSCSFVSILIPLSVIQQIGLPYKEFFIWGDDSEYTRRIVSYGYKGYYVPASVVLHETKENYCVDMYNDIIENLWKYKYGVRNELFIVRKFGGVMRYILFLFYYLLWKLPNLFIKRDNGRCKFAKIVCISVFKSMFFRPKVRFVK